MKIFTDTLNKVKDGKNDAINMQNFELAAALRDVEIEMCFFSHNNSTNDLKSLVKHLTAHKFYYKDMYNKFLISLERLDKFEQINIIIKPLVRRDKILKIEKLNKNI